MQAVLVALKLMPSFNDIQIDSVKTPVRFRYMGGKQGAPVANFCCNVQTYKLAPNKVHMELTIDEVMILALAAFFHDNAKYAKRSRDKVYAWFLDPQRGMKPTLRGAAVHAGVTKYGRPEGIADLAQLSDLLNAVGLLQRVCSQRSCQCHACQMIVGLDSVVQKENII